MRTMLFLISGLCLMAFALIVAKLFAEHFASSLNRALVLAILVWFVVTATNMWIGVFKAGYSVTEELPIMLLLFGVPVALAVIVRWRYF